MIYFIEAPQNILKIPPPTQPCGMKGNNGSWALYTAK